MDGFARIYELHNLLKKSKYPVSYIELEQQLECSHATVERAIENLRDYLGAPLSYDGKANGYFYDGEAEHPNALAGLWFNASELHALFVTETLQSNVQAGLLASHLTPLKQRTPKILNRNKPRVASCPNALA